MGQPGRRLWVGWRRLPGASNEAAGIGDPLHRDLGVTYTGVRGGVQRFVPRQRATTRVLPKLGRRFALNDVGVMPRREGIREASPAGCRNGRFVLRLATDVGPFCGAEAHRPQARYGATRWASGE